MSWLMRMLLFLCSAILLVYGYVGWRLNRALAILTSWPDSKRRLSILLLVIVLNLYPVAALVVYTLSSSMDMSALQGENRLVNIVLIYPFWISLTLVFQLLPFLLLLDAGRFLLVKYFPAPAAVKRWAASLTLLLTAIACVYTVIRVYHDTWHVRITERIIHTAKLAPRSPELRIVHITDVQVDPYTGPLEVRPFVDKINRLDPDLVVFTGDLITSGTAYIDLAASMLGKIRARYGVFACLGDHDVWADSDWIVRSLKANGIVVLADENRLLDLGQNQLQLSGVTNVYSHRPRWSQLERLAAHRGYGPFSILLTHQPSDSLVEFAEKHGYDLFLAGHTHGGQVVINFLGLRLSPAWRDTQYLSGFYEVGPMLLSVSNGLGLTFAPLRFQAPAEITLLRLRPLEITE